MQLAILIVTCLNTVLLITIIVLVVKTMKKTTPRATVYFNGNTPKGLMQQIEERTGVRHQ